MTGDAGINAVAEHPDAVSVVTGIVGCAGLYPTVAAIKAGKARTNTPFHRPPKPLAAALACGPQSPSADLTRACPRVRLHTVEQDICLANKETLIAGGPFVLPLARQHGVSILPADSEHSAIFQCIQARAHRLRPTAARPNAAL